jgi:beta-lactamase regulating signal transducer with metallopeptidase domain
VLALGSLAAKLCRQPVRRARVVMLTLLVAFAVPWLGALSFAPKWSAGFVIASPAARVPSMVNTLTAPAHATLRTSIETPRGPVALEAGDAPLSQRLERPTLQPADGRRVAQSWALWLTTRPWDTFVLAAYTAMSAGLAAWWLLGQFLLWRITRNAQPVPLAIREIFHTISGAAGRGVLLQVGQSVELPFTFTWLRPVIVLPTALCDWGDSDELRFCLAHEWSHVERRDARAWNLAALAGFVLFYQPLFWWLRRQLRLCQDFLADDRAAAVASAEDYATYLVRLARGRHTGPILLALGVSDRRSNVFRRIAMLVEDHEPLEHRCRTFWSLGAAVSAAVVMVVASGFRLNAAGPPEAKDPSKGPFLLEVRASPAVVIEGQWLDSKGQPKSGWGSSVFGRIDGSFWHAQTAPDAQGKFSLRVPHGLEQVELDISTNEHASAKHRIGKDGPLTDGRRVKLGTLDHDVKGIEIVRYVAPIIVVNATTKGGQQVEGFKATVEYIEPGPNSAKKVHVVGGGKTEALQDEQ